jgi:hypothetical protein
VLEASALRLGDGGCDEGERGELSGEVVGGVIVIVVGSCEASIGGACDKSCELKYSLDSFIFSFASWRCLYTAYSVKGSKLA